LGGIPPKEPEKNPVWGSWYGLLLTWQNCDDFSLGNAVWRFSYWDCVTTRFSYTLVTFRHAQSVSEF